MERLKQSGSGAVAAQLEHRMREAKFSWGYSSFSRTLRLDWPADGTERVKL